MDSHLEQGEILLKKNQLRYREEMSRVRAGRVYQWWSCTGDVRPHVVRVKVRAAKNVQLVSRP